MLNLVIPLPREEGRCCRKIYIDAEASREFSMADSAKDRRSEGVAKKGEWPHLQSL